MSELKSFIQCGVAPTARRRGRAELMVLNGEVITLDPACPAAEAVAIRAGQVMAVGTLDQLRPLIGGSTEVVDAERGLVIPAFHDAHLHLLSYARSRSWVDCGTAGSIAELQAAIAARARDLPVGNWVRAIGYDDHRLTDGRHPDRHDLDAAAPEHPVRLQHRGLHLDVLNTTALRRLDLLGSDAPGERDLATGEPTGRLFHYGDRLGSRVDRVGASELARAVRLAGERLLSWGVTSVQDATVTNGADTWELFHRLADRGDLMVRAFVLAGADRWREMDDGRPPGELVRRGPVKLMVNEATADPAEVRAAVAEIRRSGKSIAIHAVTEAELAIALDALRSRPKNRLPSLPATQGPGRRPLSVQEEGVLDRIEHAAVVPDAMLSDLHAAGVTVIGQPAFIYERGDVYLAEHPAEQWSWLYRVRSLLAAGIPYAASSDAPVGDPNPWLAVGALRRRRTRSGRPFGPREAIDVGAALAACTDGPGRTIGMAGRLGQIRPGALADIAVLDRDALRLEREPAGSRLVRVTIRDGRVVWRRSGS